MVAVTTATNTSGLAILPGIGCLGLICRDDLVFEFCMLAMAASIFILLVFDHTDLGGNNFDLFTLFLATNMHFMTAASTTVLG